MATDVSCKFFGNTSIYISDGTSHIFIDAFLSRPALEQGLETPIGPDRNRIIDAISKGKVKSLDAIFVAHSHYDHAMDAPEVIKHLGGKLYGSESTLNIGRGQGLPEESLQLITDAEHHTIGDFTIHIFQGIHSPGNTFPGTITTPLPPPAKANEYLDGGCFSFHITHPRSGPIFVHPSANFIPDKFKDVKVDIFYLGIGILGKQSREFQDEYWRHTIEATKPRVVIPVHWDNFFEPLKEALEPPLEEWDDLGATKVFLEEKRKEGWEVVWQGLFEVVYPRVVQE